jgi:broad specificity phosphatase PhoE
VTVVHLLRHGEHMLAGRVLAGRTPGVSLSEKGRAEIAAMAERLAPAGIEALYASPLQRTKESAEIVSARLDLPIRFREDVIELDFGEWTGLTFDEVRADPRWELWRNCRSIARVPGGESMHEVHDRTVNALLDLRRSHPDGRILVVSHGDVIRAAVLFALGMPLDLYARIEVAIASLSTIRIDDSGIRAVAVNERLPL